MMDTVIVTIAGGLTCLVFLRAALHKWGDRAEFAGILADYRVLPAPLVPAAAALLPPLETAAALMLVLPATRAAGAALAMALLLLYAAALGWNLVRGRHSIDCGCGGPGHGISWLHLLRNAVLAGIASVPLWLQRAHQDAAAGMASATATIACVGLLWLMVLLFEQLLGNRTHAAAAFHSRYR